MEIRHLWRTQRSLQNSQQELRLPIARLVDTLRDELAVGRADFEELKAIVRELAQAQPRTEVRLEELARAQQRMESSMEALRGAVGWLKRNSRQSFVCRS